jgi:biopolymer transport protein ExbD
MEEIPARIRLAADGAKRSVIIRADKKLYYGLAVQVMGVCSESGVSDIGLAVL